MDRQPLSARAMNRYEGEPHGLVSLPVAQAFLETRNEDPVAASTKAVKYIRVNNHGDQMDGKRPSLVSVHFIKETVD